MGIEDISMKALVLLSGGLDSATCLAMKVAEYGKDQLAALNVFYGQKHSREIESARKVAAHYGVQLEEFDLKNVMEGSDCPLLEGSDRGIEHRSYAEQVRDEGPTVSTYVPFRNGLMLSIAAARAIILGCSEICYGAHADDAAGSAYPDCTPEFYSSMDSAIYEGSGHKLHLTAPLINMNKAGVVKRGLELKVPYELTWSCYEGGDSPCHSCGTCIDRENAFKSNGTIDPLCR